MIFYARSLCDASRRLPPPELQWCSNADDG